jgi:hypothetical protein
MSDTPLTDEQVLAYITEDGSELVHASAARELETKLAAEREKVRALRYVLSRIFEAMPTKRDWLDPVLEKVALAETKEDSK